MKISDDFIKIKNDTECVLVPTNEEYTNGIFTLNETAERIYDLLCEGKSREEIVAVLFDEYETDRETAEAFTDKYIKKLCDIGILTDNR